MRTSWWEALISPGTILVSALASTARAMMRYFPVVIGVVTPSQKVWTEAELEALPEDGFVREVVDGRLVTSPKNNFYHGEICSRLLAALVNFNDAHKLGAVLDS